jgi:hypothetical protein
MEDKRIRNESQESRLRMHDAGLPEILIKACRCVEHSSLRNEGRKVVVRDQASRSTDLQGNAERTIVVTLPVFHPLILPLNLLVT